MRPSIHPPLVPSVQSKYIEPKKLSLKQSLALHNAKAIIKSDNYPRSRLDKIHLQILYWISSAKMANTTAEKQFCSTMITMYQKRYQWYLNKYLVK